MDSFPVCRRSAEQDSRELCGPAIYTPGSIEILSGSFSAGAAGVTTPVAARRRVC